MKYFLLMFLCLVIPTIGQTNQTYNSRQEIWWYNLPTTPLEFVLTQNKRFLCLVNHSSKSISKYKFGCITEENGQVKIISESAATNTSLEQEKALISSINAYTAEKQICEKENSKLSIVEVVFSDGSIWKPLKKEQ